MARGRKKEELTLEEKLERALVPVEEQPYEVPENWCWVYQNIACQLGDGEKRNDEEHPYLEVKYLRGHKEADIKKTGKYIEAGTKIILVDGENSGEVFEVSENGYMGSTFKTLNISSGINEKYLLYFVDSKRDLLRKSKTGSAIPHLNKKLFFSLEFPLPPLQEQQRIVERIERLFAKLDEAKEKIQEILDGSEERKAAILHKAFSGKLTEKWRKENKFFDEWKTTTIKECCKMGSGGTPSRKCLEYYQGSIPWIKTGEINWNEIYSAEECISEMGVENSSAKIYEEGAILVAMYGMGVTRGRAAILKTKAATNQAVCVLIPCKDILNYFLFYYFMCNYWDVRKQAVGGNQLNLSATIIGAFEIEIPSMEEQKEIVRLLDVLLEREEQSKENVEIVLDCIEMTKKAILARAFRGELGTNSPEERSAIELLKTILVET